jgi:hypothetical protein
VACWFGGASTASRPSAKFVKTHMRATEGGMAKQIGRIACTRFPSHQHMYTSIVATELWAPINRREVRRVLILSAKTGTDVQRLEVQSAGLGQMLRACH